MSTSQLLVTSTITTFPYKNTPRAFKTRTNQTQGLRVSCNSAPNDQGDNTLILPESLKLVLPNLDRRTFVGLGPLYTITNLVAKGGPIITPDITAHCKDVDRGDNTLINCCPPKLQKTIKPFVFPKENTVRMRWPAHKGTPEQMKKFKTAIQAMKDLPHDHPHSFASQAKIHCAYCNGAYTEFDSGFPNIRIEIHNSWLFFPFHRWYLYFFERILGKLINDPTFALPFWQWDESAGMQMPQMFVPENIDGKKNFLYDPFRDNKHLPPAIVDLDYADNDNPHNDQVQRNKCTMYRDLISNAGDPISFFGAIYEAGEEPIPDDKSIGSVETGCHNNVHRWVGDPNQPLYEDMGVFYSAARDPLFYAHHANIDRMWKLWKGLPLPGHVDLTHPSWLNASYVFYDENEDLVRVYNKDCVDILKLKYDFIENPNEVSTWSKSRLAKRSTMDQVESTRDVATVDKLSFPTSLNDMLMVRVKRPAVNRTIEEKAKSNEILRINGIKFVNDKFVKFDVFVNTDKLREGIVPTPCDPEYAGGFSMIPHNNKTMSSGARFGLRELLELTNSEGDEYVTVKLVPRIGCEGLTIGNITIELVDLL